MKNILVTIDFSLNENILLDKVIELANAFGSKVWLMHIAAPDPDFVGYEVGPQYIRDTRAEELRKEHRLLQEYTSQLKVKGIEAEGLLVQGATLEMIIKESKKLKADLIIAGHHTHGFFYNAFVGSTSSKIIQRSEIPVLIIPLEQPE